MPSLTTIYNRIRIDRNVHSFDLYKNRIGFEGKHNECEKWEKEEEKKNRDLREKKMASTSMILTREYRKRTIGNSTLMMLHEYRIYIRICSCTYYYYRIITHTSYMHWRQSFAATKTKEEEKNILITSADSSVVRSIDAALWLDYYVRSILALFCCCCCCCSLSLQTFTVLPH